MMRQVTTNAVVPVTHKLQRRSYDSLLHGPAVGPHHYALPIPARRGGAMTMTWHYQVRQREDTGTIYFDIAEVYTDPDGSTINSIAPIGDTKDELILVLEMVLRDAKKYPVRIEAPP
jgi:hypothetical protein